MTTAVLWDWLWDFEGITDLIKSDEAVPEVDLGGACSAQEHSAQSTGQVGCAQCANQNHHLISPQTDDRLLNWGR